jgi:hypothetical protein
MTGRNFVRDRPVLTGQWHATEIRAVFLVPLHLVKQLSNIPSSCRWLGKAGEKGFHECDACARSVERFRVIMKLK